MSAILALAAKDLRLLIRVKSGLFFAFAWPLVIAILFGAIFSPSGTESRRMAVALADEDQSAGSRDFAALLAKSADFDVRPASRVESIGLVRKRQEAAALILPKGFGEASQQMFHGTPPKVEVWIDPSRQAEGAMIQGLLFQIVMKGFQKKMADTGAMRAGLRQSIEEVERSKAPPGQRASTARFLESMDRALGEMPAASGAGGGGQGAQWEPLSIEQHDVAIQQEGPRNAFEITFPQGMLWGVLGCAMAFAIGFVSERTHGTLLRLQMAPIGRVQLLAGKALACAVACLAIEVTLMAIGRFGFHVVPHSWALLALAGVSTVAAFVGMMMLIAGLGKTEQAAAGVGWAVMMPLAMFGGGMVPLAFMPHWMATAGTISPVRWGILAFEGALWRGFSFQEMLLPCAILLATGAVCFAIGTRTLRLS
ncbi:MAG TPA: ABC transporter permease [Bryobacteraceae bacterium]|nr:ABC transporter permease [Bryobacteraceae bacterium]